MKNIITNYNNCINDGGIPTAITIQAEIENHFKVLYSKGYDIERYRKGNTSCQVCSMEYVNERPYEDFIKNSV